MKKVMFCLAVIGTVGSASCMKISLDLRGLGDAIKATTTAVGKAAAVVGGIATKGGARVVEVGVDPWKKRPDWLKNTGIIRDTKNLGSKLLNWGLK